MQLKTNYVGNKLGGLSREDKQYQGFRRDCEPGCGLSHTQDKWLKMKQPLNQGFYCRLRKGLHILTGVILSAFPSQFVMNITKTAQEQEAKKPQQLTAKTKPIQTLCAEEIVQEHFVLWEKVILKSARLERAWPDAAARCYRIKR